MKPFELFLCCLGNGITVCNKAVQESGDYKTIAHIRGNGKVKWYMNPQTYVPAPELEKIKRTARNQKETLEKWFASLSKMGQYAFLMDHIPLSDYPSIMQHMDSPLEYKIRLAREAFDRII